MAEQTSRVHVDQVAWLEVFPFLHLFRSFRMAIAPGKLLLAMMLVLLAYLGGLGMDLVWGARVYPGEVQQYLRYGRPEFHEWAQNARRFAEGDRLSGGRFGLQPNARVFESALEAEVRAFDQMIGSAAMLDFGFQSFLATRGRSPGGVMGALYQMVIGVPGWMYTAHWPFLLVYMVYGFLLVALIGGAIARLAGLHACRQERPSAFAGLRFVGERYGWFVLAPLIPLVVVLAMGVVLALLGALFNLEILDVVGAVLFGPMLVLGLVAALLLIGLLATASMMMPAIAVEGSDAFDAISRTYNYVMGRPWRFLFYNAVAVVYGAVTYLFVGLVLFFAMWLTRVFAGLLVFRAMQPGESRLEAVLPQPQFGELSLKVDWDLLDTSGTASAAVMLVWIKLLLALLPAFALAFYFCSQTWIYLLLRKSADGTELSEVYVEPARVESAGNVEKVEPQA